MENSNDVIKVLNLRHCEIVIFKQYLKVDIQQVCKKYETIKHWAYILHDKDDTEPHYHIYLHFGDSSVKVDLIAKWFHLEFVDYKGILQNGSNFVRKVKGRRSDVLLYLIHGNDSARHKYQYSPGEVIANFNFKTEIDNAKILGNFEQYSFREQLEYVNMLPVSEKAKAYRHLKQLHEVHLSVLATRTERDIEVIFIQGGTGTAKTSYAKLMLRKLGYDFAVSSSSNDPFQDYLGERAIILDDLRDTTFSFVDLLKLLDNNTRSSIKSRFTNKMFEGKMIVVTSVVPLVHWYREYRINNRFDDLNQLYRRFSTYVELTPSAIRIYDSISLEGKPINCLKVLDNTFIQKVEKKKKKKTNLVKILNDVNFDLLEDKINIEEIDKCGEATQLNIPGFKTPLENIKSVTSPDLEAIDD